VDAPVRLIATDLDGTIVRHDGSVSARTINAFSAAATAGIRVVFVTGRPPRWMHEVADATGHRGIGICANGAYVYDMHDEVVVETFSIPVDVATQAVKVVRQLLPNAGFAMESESGFGHDTNYRPRWEPESLLGVGPIEDLFTDPIAKVLVRDRIPGDDMLRIVGPELVGLVEVTHSDANDSLLELSAMGVTKATTLERLAAQWGITRDEVVAFGDMPNDLEMLRWAGRGYAVSNAHPSVLAAADAHAASIDDDGVAQVIETLVKSVADG